VIFLLLLLSRDTTIIVTVIVLFALLYGATFWVTAPLTVVFARAEFGTAQLGVITGLITMVHHIAGGLGAYIGAALFDSQGHYDSVFQLMLGLSLLAVLLCLAARRQHDK
jgi:predicted MFS family arabinose efflux permease